MWTTATAKTATTATVHFLINYITQLARQLSNQAHVTASLRFVKVVLTVQFVMMNKIMQQFHEDFLNKTNAQAITPYIIDFSYELYCFDNYRCWKTFAMLLLLGKVTYFVANHCSFLCDQSFCLCMTMSLKWFIWFNRLIWARSLIPPGIWKLTIPHLAPIFCTCLHLLYMFPTKVLRTTIVHTHCWRRKTLGNSRNLAVMLTGISG